MTSFWQTVESELEQGARVFVALVVRHSEHSPGTTGARLLVSQNGRIEGTVGGGAMEFEIVERAKRVVTSDIFEPEIQTLVHRDRGQGDKSGMICAGEQTNLYVLLSPDDLPLVALAATATSGEIRIDSSGISFAMGLPDLPERQYELIERAGDWVYREQTLCLRRVAIMGGGHCGLALSEALARLGYHIHVFETRADLDTMRRNTFASEKTVIADFADAAGLVENPEATEVIVMTTDFPSDIRALTGALRRPFPFIGLMGSAAKIKRIRDELRNAGLDSESLSRITAPVGLAIGSDTPEEIAISVAAQLVKRRKGTPEVGADA